jgi:hypothetical protein
MFREVTLSLLIMIAVEYDIKVGEEIERGSHQKHWG